MKPEKLGRFLAYVLRHHPEELDLELDPEGWTDVEHLLKQLKRKKGWLVSLRQLREVVEQDSKGRYSLENGKIRANQGHSVAVQAVEETPVSPPDFLFHGTTQQRWIRIQKSGGLKPMNRHHVHLSADPETALEVGRRRRRETPIVLTVEARLMESEGHRFLRSSNGVYHVDSVPLSYLKVRGTDD